MSFKTMLLLVAWASTASAQTSSPPLTRKTIEAPSVKSAQEAPIGKSESETSGVSKVIVTPSASDGSTVAKASSGILVERPKGEVPKKRTANQRFQEINRIFQHSEGHCVFPDEIIIEEDDEDEIRDPSGPSAAKIMCDSSQKECQALPFDRHLTRIAAASVATLFSSFVTYPLDQRRMLQQYGSDLTGYWSNPKLWVKGMGPQLLANGLSVGVGMCGYDYLKEQRGMSPFEAGALSTLAANGVATPLFVLRAQKSLAPKGQPYSFLGDYVQALKKNPRLAYRGNVMNLMALGPQAAYYHFYEIFNDEIKKRVADEPGSALEFARHAVAAGGARIVISGASYPMETIRTLRQKDGMSYSDIIAKLNSEGGVKRFYAGYLWSTVRAAKGTALYFGAYHALKKRFEMMQEKRD